MVITFFRSFTFLYFTLEMKHFTPTNILHRAIYGYDCVLMVFQIFTIMACKIRSLYENNKNDIKNHTRKPAIPFCWLHLPHQEYFF